MAKRPLALLFLTLLCVPVPAFAGDLKLEVFDHQLGAGLRPTSVVSFPDYDQNYSEVILTLESFNPCEVGVDGDEWDRTAYIYVQDEDDELIQIARWLTPYWNLPFTWTVDITEMQSVLHNDRKIFVDLGGRHQYSLSFDLSFGTPPRLPARATTMWRGSPGVAAVEDFFSPLELEVHERADFVDVRINISSHGGDGPIEFGPAQSAQLGVNGEISPDWYHYYSRGDDDLSDGFNCPDNPTGPQGSCAATQPACAVDDEQAGGNCVTGNWGGPRINWCPGELIPSWIVDVSSAITPGELAAVDLGYSNVAIAGAGSLRVDSQWIELRATDTMIVAPLADWAPRRFAGEELAGSGRSYWVENHEPEPIEWSASVSVDWLTLSETSGELGPGEALEVGLNFNAETDALGLGDFAATVSFYDVTNDRAELRTVDLALEAKGVLAYWPIEDEDEDEGEAGGEVILDRSGRELHGALLDATGPSRSEGRFGAGLPLTAGLERVEVPGAIVAGHQHSSYSLWFQTSSTATQMLLTGGPEHQPGAFRLFMAGDGTQLNFHAHSHTATWSELSLADGEWHHLIATLDGDEDTLGLYLDGAALEAQTLAWAGRLDMADGGATIGAQLAAETTVVEGTSFEGGLDDLRIYNYVLDGDEVAQIFVGGPAIVPSPFDDERRVELDRDLTWVAGATALSHKLYLGRDYAAVRDADESSELFMGELEVPSFDPGELAQTRYFWRVDEITQAGVIPGVVWRFDTDELTEGTGDSGTSGGQAMDTAGGCGCSATPTGSGALAGLGLLLLPLLSRRRARVTLPSTPPQPKHRHPTEHDPNI